MSCPIAGGAAVVRASADPHLEGFEGRTEPGPELGEGGAVVAGQGGFVRGDGRGRGLEDSIGGLVIYGGGDGGGVEGGNGGFVVVRGKDAP